MITHTLAPTGGHQVDPTVAILQPANLQPANLPTCNLPTFQPSNLPTCERPMTHHHGDSP